MAFSLDDVRGTRRDMPERLLIHGIHKVGKTTFAASAPGCIFIPTEDGQESVDANAFPLCRSWDDILSAITTLYTEPHEFKTAVLDSGDWAELLARKAVCDEHNQSGIEEFGYGKGYQFTAERYAEMLDGLNALRLERGMRIVMVVHTEIKKFEDPLADAYDRYQIKLHKSIGKLVQEWADVIGFAQAAATTKEEKKDFQAKGDKGRTRAIDLGKRIVCFERSAAYDAGNRFGLPAELPLDWSAYEAALTEAKNRSK